MTKRAEAEEETRRRITQSTVDLHEALGPSRTSVSAIAEHAGVRRSTVYRHFPDELALFTACSTQWMAANPPPDPAPWAAMADPEERLLAALNALYAYYRSTRRMMENLHRDEEIVPLVKEMMQGYRGYLESLRGLLLVGRGSERTDIVRAGLGHALSFPAWRSLALEQGLSDAASSRLMCRMVEAAHEQQQGS